MNFLEQNLIERANENSHEVTMKTVSLEVTRKFLKFKINSVQMNVSIDQNEFLLATI